MALGYFLRKLAFPAAFALLARVFEADALRTARARRFVVILAPPTLPRVDLRDGVPVFESSSRAPPLAAARFDLLRPAVLPPPTFLSLALTPGSEVSTTVSRRGRAGLLAFGGRALRICWVLKTSALVAMRHR